MCENILDESGKIIGIRCPNAMGIEGAIGPVGESNVPEGGQTGATGSRRSKLLNWGDVVCFQEIAPPVIGQKVQILNIWYFRIDEVHDAGHVWVIQVDKSELPVRLAGSTG